eukprot:scaffold1052_cov339-Pavlova_lutheri.AAC.24
MVEINNDFGILQCVSIRSKNTRADRVDGCVRWYSRPEPWTKVRRGELASPLSSGLRGERFTAATLSLAVRIVEHEFRPDSVLYKIQLRTDDVHECGRVDQELHAELMDLFVEFAFIFRVVQGVRFPVATLRFHADAQVLGLSLVQQRADAFRGCFGELQHLLLRPPSSRAGFGPAFCDVFRDLCTRRGPSRPRHLSPRACGSSRDRQCASHGPNLRAKLVLAPRSPTYCFVSPPPDLTPQAPSPLYVPRAETDPTRHRGGRTVRRIRTRTAVRAVREGGGATVRGSKVTLGVEVDACTPRVAMDCSHGGEPIQ